LPLLVLFLRLVGATPAVCVVLAALGGAAAVAALRLAFCAFRCLARRLAPAAALAAGGAAAAACSADGREDAATKFAVVVTPVLLAAAATAAAATAAAAAAAAAATAFAICPPRFPRFLMRLPAFAAAALRALTEAVWGAAYKLAAVVALAELTAAVAALCLALCAFRFLVRLLAPDATPTDGKATAAACSAGGGGDEVAKFAVVVTWARAAAATAFAICPPRFPRFLMRLPAFAAAALRALTDAAIVWGAAYKLAAVVALAGLTAAVAALRFNICSPRLLARLRVPAAALRWSALPAPVNVIPISRIILAIRSAMLCAIAINSGESRVEDAKFCCDIFWVVLQPNKPETTLS
jgi:hypothetical protein